MHKFINPNEFFNRCFFNCVSRQFWRLKKHIIGWRSVNSRHQNGSDPRVEMKVPCMPNSPKSFIKACSRRETYVYVQSCTRMCPVYPVIDVPCLSFEIYVNIIELIYIYVATKENGFTEICVNFSIFSRGLDVPHPLFTGSCVHVPRITWKGDSRWRDGEHPIVCLLRWSEFSDSIFVGVSAGRESPCQHPQFCLVLVSLLDVQSMVWDRKKCAGCAVFNAELFLHTPGSTNERYGARGRVSEKWPPLRHLLFAVSRFMAGHQPEEKGRLVCLCRWCSVQGGWSAQAGDG